MSEAVNEIYQTLSVSAQKEVYDFMLFLYQRQIAEQQKQHEEAQVQEKLSALYKLSGSMKDIWKGEDALEYQNKVREEREIG